MTSNERVIAAHLLEQIAAGLPDGPNPARSAHDVLHKLVTTVHGAADHGRAKAPVKRRRRKMAPSTNPAEAAKAAAAAVAGPQ